MPKATITKVTFKKEITHETYGSTNVYQLELSDGVKGDLMCKDKDNCPVVGQEIEYDYEPNPIESFYGKIKLIKKKTFPTFGGGAKKNEKAENARNALTNAVNLIIAGKAKEGYKTIELADSLFAWLESKTN